MDGLRKVPDNVPQRELLEKNLHKPLTQVPDPFNKYNSFGVVMDDVCAGLYVVLSLICFMVLKSLV